MTSISMDQVKALRDKTGISIMQCKKALEEAGGDTEKAVVILQKIGAEKAATKADRNLGSGVISAYVHSNSSVASLVEVSCETDFVAKNEEFQKFAYEIAMHIAAMKPEFLSEEDITDADKRAALELFTEEAQGKPEEMKEKIIQGKMGAYFNEKTLLNQPYIKDADKKITDLVTDATQKFGERIEIKRFVRYAVGDAR